MRNHSCQHQFKNYKLEDVPTNAFGGHRVSNWVTGPSSCHQDFNSVCDVLNNRFGIPSEKKTNQMCLPAIPWLSIAEIRVWDLSYLNGHATFPIKGAPSAASALDSQQALLQALLHMQFRPTDLRCRYAGFVGRQHVINLVIKKAKNGLCLSLWKTIWRRKVPFPVSLVPPCASYARSPHWSCTKATPTSHSALLCFHTAQNWTALWLCANISLRALLGIGRRGGVPGVRRAVLECAILPLLPVFASLLKKHC